MTTRRIPLILGIIVLVALAFVGVAAACEDSCGDSCDDGCGDCGGCNLGCTPGFWKNHPEEWRCLDPDEIMEPPYADLNGDGEEDTFMDALRYKGGSGDIGAERILLRAGVAAYLNECAFEDFPDVWKGEFFGYLDDPFDQRDNMLDLAGELDSLNNGVCEFT